jgi:GLPGLI family protein
VKVMTVVWFTPEINYSFGPAGFDGLPGLVLEKYSSSFYFIASKISFKNHTENKNIHKPKDGIEITNDEYNQNNKDAINKLFKN